MAQAIFKTESNRQPKLKWRSAYDPSSRRIGVVKIVEYLDERIIAESRFQTRWSWKSDLPVCAH